MWKTLIALTLVWSSANANILEVNGSEGQLLSFSAWKDQKRQQMEGSEQEILRKMNVTKNAGQQRQLHEELLSVRWSKEAHDAVGVKEYLKLYVAKQKNVNLQSLAAALSDQEVADLLADIIGAERSVKVAKGAARNLGKQNKISVFTE